MTGKRGHGEGSITRDKRDGRWRATLRLPNGRRRNLYGATRREVAEKLATLRREVSAGMHGTLAGDKRLKDFAAEYLALHPELRSNTLRNYRWVLAMHCDGIGDVALTKLTAQMIQAHYAKELETCGVPTLQKLHVFLHLVLGQAVRLDIIPKNPADFVDLPGDTKRDYAYLSAAQVAALLAGLMGVRLAPLWVLALSTGMRAGELLGLRWAEVDLGRAQVRVALTLHRVNHEYVLEPPKSRASARTIPLPRIAVEYLLAWRAVQDEECALMGAAWEDRFGLVFTMPSGRPHNVTLVRWHFGQLMRRLGLPAVRVHDLRHTFATLLIERGVAVKVVSELLGHSSIAITLGIYGHVTPRMRDQALTELNDLLRSDDGAAGSHE